MVKTDTPLLGFLNPNNLSVRALLTQAVVWVIVGNSAVLLAFVLAGLFQDSAQDGNQRAVDVQRDIDTVSAEVYKLSALEERLLRLKDLDLGDKHSQLIGLAKQDIVALREKAKDNGGILTAADQISSALDDYSAKMKRLVVLQREVGISQDTGIVGELGAISASVEYDTNAVNDKRLLMFHKRLQGAERGYTQSKNPDFLLAFQKAHQRFAGALDGAAIDQEKKAAITAKLPSYLDTMERLVEREQALLQALASMQVTAARIPELVGDVHRLAQEQSAQAAADLASVRTMATWVVVCLSLGVMALLSFGAFWLQRRIGPPLDEAVEGCEAFAAGDLTVVMRQEYRGDEIGALQNALAEMSERLRSVVAEVRAGAHVIFQGASEISAANEHLSSRTEESAASLEQTASSMEQMNSTVKQTANNAAHASELADKTRDKAQSGGVVVEKAVSAMQDISNASHRVESVISVVNEIAFQTNLLALNAAVEAARAGDAGRGFAVVASEVRTLAQRSADSAEEVRKLIGDSAAAVESGQALVNQSGQFLSEIIEEMQNVTKLISEIKNATLEQSEGIDQVNQAVLEMDKVTQQNAAMVEQAAAASKAMEDKAQELAQLVGYFKVDRGGARGIPALEAH